MLRVQSRLAVSEHRDFVLRAPVGRALWSLAWPMALSNELAILTMGVVLFWLGRLVGEAGLVVEALYRPVELLITWLFGATSVGASVIVSRSIGAKDDRGLAVAAGSVSLTLAMWIGLVVIVVPTAPWLAGALVGDLPVERQMLQYVIGWVLVALPGLSVAEVLLDVASSTGNTKLTIVRVLVDLAFAAALTPVLISVAGMGIAGGPVSQGIAAGGLCVALWIMLVRGRTKLALGELPRGAWRPQWGLWKEILAIGLPVQISRMAYFVSQLILLQMIAREGEDRVAGYGIAGALFLFGTMATLALAQGGSILVGQALGAGLTDRARQGVRAALISGWFVMALFVVVTLFDRSIIGLFTSDPGITDAASHALSILRWAGFGVAAFQILMSSFAAYRATIRASLLMVGAEVVGLAVAFAWPGSALDAACFAVVAANTLKGALLLVLMPRITRQPPGSTPHPAH